MKNVIFWLKSRELMPQAIYSHGSDASPWEALGISS
jgi:hypothetical protein